MKYNVFLALLLLLQLNVCAQRREYPITLAYCLDGRSQDIKTREIQKSNPQIGYITFYKDRIIVDNKEVYTLWQEADNGVKAFQGNQLNVNGYAVIPVIFADPGLNDVVLFMTAPEANITLKAPIYLMEVSDFIALQNRYNGMSNNIFVNNAQNGSTNYNYSEGSKSYYENRYGYKDCHVCHGSGICQTCNGRTYQHNSFGLDDSPCANCHREYGKRTGKCSRCQGTGKVYGLK